MISTFAVLQDRPQGLVFGQDGNLYVGEGNRITKITSQGLLSTLVTFDASQSFALDLGIDASGTLYAGNFDGTVYKVTTDGTVVPFVTGLSFPTGIAFDPSNNLYTANFDGTIRKTSPVGASSTFASGLNRPEGLAFGPDGILYSADSGYANTPGTTISRISLTGSVTTFATVDSSPSRLTFTNAVAAPEPASIGLVLMAVLPLAPRCLRQGAKSSGTEIKTQSGR